MQPKLRIELRTSSLQDWCSTSKLFGLGLLREDEGNYKKYVIHYIVNSHNIIGTPFALAIFYGMLLDLMT